MAHVTEHVVQGLITIRLVGATAGALGSVEEAFGPSRGEPSAVPDIQVTFGPVAPDRRTLRYLGLNSAAFDDEHFYVLDGEGRFARLDLRRLGQEIELEIEPGSHIPFLVSMVGLRLAAKQHVLLHSSAFRHRGRGTLVTGWQKGGKTETLLAYLSAGAEYVSDEWTIVGPGGRRVYGLPSILRVWNWHVRQTPQYRPRLHRGERARLAALDLYQRAYRRLPGERPLARLPRDIARRAGREGGLASIGQVRVTPDRLLRDAWTSEPMDLHHVLFATVDDEQIAVRALAGEEIAERMVASLHWERRDLLAAYEQFRFAFPDRRSEAIEGIRARELELLRAALAGRTCHELTHPYPVSFEALRAATGDIIGGPGR